MITNWLSAVNTNDISSYFDKTYQKGQNFPEIKNSKIALLSSNISFANAVRSSFSSLYNHFETEIIDIGNLVNSNPSAVYQVLSELQEGHILPIILGVKNSEFQELCKSMVMEGKLSNAAFISNHISLAPKEFNIDNIGFQRHLTPKHHHLENAEQNSSGLSLGTLRRNQKIVEPILREANYIHFDMACIRRSDTPAISSSLPTGLYAEEACQLMRYSGEGSRLRFVSINCHDLQEDNTIESMLVAEMLWYLHEGVESRWTDHPTISNDFQEFIVELDSIDHSLFFYQSNKSGKWWLKAHSDSNNYISCAFEEYQKTAYNEIPDRLLKLL